jgi:e3 binding domain
MARETQKSRPSGSRRGRNAASRNGKPSSRNSDGKRPALEARRRLNDADLEYRRYVHREEEDPAGPPDVLLDVPELRIDSIHFELDDLDAHVAAKANVLNLVKLTVGIDVHLERVKLDIKGVEAELVLKARLDHIAAIVDRLMTSLDRNPELVKGLSRAVSEVGAGAGEAVGETGGAVKDIGAGAQGALGDVGKGAGEATGDIGEGAGQAVGDIGQGAGQAVGDVGQGAGQAVGDIGQGAGQAVGNLDQLVGGVGQTLGEAGQGAGQAVGGLTQGVGQAGQGAGQAVGGLTQGVGQAGQGATQALGGLGQAQDGGPQQAQQVGQSNGAAPAEARPGAVAKELAKVVAREVGHAASDEVRDIGLAATRKVRELGDRREQRRAHKHNATEGAIRIADEFGIDLADVEGTGSEGRITAKDVRGAVKA